MYTEKTKDFSFILLFIYLFTQYYASFIFYNIKYV